MTGLLVHIHQKEKIAVKVASANGPLLFTSGIVLVCGKYNVYPAKHSIHIYRDVLGGGGGGGALHGAQFCQAGSQYSQHIC